LKPEKLTQTEMERMFDRERASDAIYEARMKVRVADGPALSTEEQVLWDRNRARREMLNFMYDRFGLYQISPFFWECDWRDGVMVAILTDGIKTFHLLSGKPSKLFLLDRPDPILMADPDDKLFASRVLVAIGDVIGI
jgi:hypothetical protein